MGTSKEAFEQDLHKEIAQSEYRRTYLSIGVILISLILAVLNYIFFGNQERQFFGTINVYLVTIIWIVVFMVYELAVLARIKKYLRHNEPVPRIFKVINVMDEISFLSALLFILIYYTRQEAFLESPIYVMYFVFLILSALHLDFRLSVLMGVVAAVEYVLIAHYTYYYIEYDIRAGIRLPLNVYYIKGLLFIIAGCCAGYVAEEINIRIRHAFDHLMAKNRIEKLFGQQVSKEVVNALINQPEKSKKVEASIMFLDIRDFTSMVESKTPQEIIEYQNKVFEPIIDIINEHEGIVNQILGDGIMASFGTPIERQDHARKAFQCGLRILNKVESLSMQRNIPFTRVGIGIHTGQVVTGNIGNNERKQFSISGSAVIIAARLEQLNKKLASQFVISKEVLTNLNGDDTSIMAVGSHELKGIGGKVEVYKVR
ncbi:MAG: adenylate/guanylate cyclase domain-containing protein [Cytophagales bacterium]|nr:adenylate/guanylate cyclase domain-containing protein [Cytophagales bacterium]